MYKRQAYNHEKYIKDALDSFLMQKTDFPFEVLIHDDASTDRTGEIIREYEKKYPHIIKPIYQTENQYSKGIKNISGLFNFPRAQGRYIAMCEGDDYFTDPYKLKKQVEYLDAHPDCSLCFHSARMVTVDGSYTDGAMRPYKGDRKVEPEEIVDKTSGYAMNSMTVSYTHLDVYKRQGKGLCGNHGGDNFSFRGHRSNCRIYGGGIVTKRNYEY